MGIAPSVRASHLPLISNDEPQEQIVLDFPSASHPIEYNTAFHQQGIPHRGFQPDLPVDSYSNRYSAVDYGAPEPPVGTEGNLTMYLQRTPSTGIPTPARDVPGQTAFGSQNVHAAAPFSLSGYSTQALIDRESTRDFQTGIDVGAGAHTNDRPLDRNDLVHAYDSAPLAMPVSLTIPVPATAASASSSTQDDSSTAGLHSHVSHCLRLSDCLLRLFTRSFPQESTLSSISDESHIHPQLRRSTYYLTSNSRTIQHGDGI